MKLKICFRAHFLIEVTKHRHETGQGGEMIFLRDMRFRATDI